MFDLIKIVILVIFVSIIVLLNYYWITLTIIFVILFIKNRKLITNLKKTTLVCVFMSIIVIPYQDIDIPQQKIYLSELIPPKISGMNSGNALSILRKLGFSCKEATRNMGSDTDPYLAEGRRVYICDKKHIHSNLWIFRLTPGEFYSYIVFSYGENSIIKVHSKFTRNYNGF